jgi:hypothetical protein
MWRRRCRCRWRATMWWWISNLSSFRGATKSRALMCNCTSENPYSRSWLWIPGLRASHASRNDDGEICALHRRPMRHRAYRHVGCAKAQSAVRTIVSQTRSKMVRMRSLSSGAFAGPIGSQWRGSPSLIIRRFRASRMLRPVEHDRAPVRIVSGHPKVRYRRIQQVWRGCGRSPLMTLS